MNPGNAERHAMQARRREGLRQAVEAAGHTGMTMTQMGALGINYHTLVKDLCDMQAAGVLLRYVEARESRYVTDPAAIVAAKARKKERDKITNAACKARRKPAPQPPKPKAAPMPKISASQAFSSAPADYSRAVITRIPTPTPRYAPDPGFECVITQDWREWRRMQEMA